MGSNKRLELPDAKAPSGHKRFQVGDLAQLLDTNPRRIEGWVEQGFLKPAIRGRGPGRRREFDMQNLLQGSLLLEVQGMFGEKSPALRRLIKRVPGNVAMFWAEGLDEATDALSFPSDFSKLVMLVMHRDGQPVFVGYDSVDAELRRARKGILGGLHVTLINVMGVIAKLRKRLAGYEKGC